MKKTGITLKDIAIVGAGIVMFGVLALPSFLHSRPTSQQNACIGNLRSIDSGKEQWSMAKSLPDGSPVVTSEVNAYLMGKMTPKCPAGGTYTYNAVGTNPQCSITSPTSHRF